METNEKLIIYQTFPRLFGNNNSTNTINGSIEENGSGKLSAFTPKVLKEIKKLGVTHVWYTGLLEHATQTDYSQYGINKDHPAIVKGRAGSPYAIKDYYDIDPDLAENIPDRMKEFEDLVKRTHLNKLKVIIDFIPNHVARQYHSDVKPDGIEDLGEKDNLHTSYDVNNNFYYIPGQEFAPDFNLDIDGNKYYEFPAKATGNDCFSAHPNRNDWYETIKLNYGIDYLNNNHCNFNPPPSTWYKMRDILLFWASKKIDGFRCDMAEMVPVEFWAWAIPSVKEQYPDILFIAEIYKPEIYRNYLQVGKFDYLYDKVGLYDTLRAVITGSSPATSITSCWQAIDDIQGNMLNFLENHDEQRIASDFFAADPWKAVPALIVSATMNKNPFMIYTGQELGERGMDEEGFSGLDGRTSIFDYWSVASLRNWYNNGKVDLALLTDEQKELRSIYSKILNLCNNSKAIREGKFYDLMYVNPPGTFFNPDKQFAYMRFSDGELILIVANFDNQDLDIKVFLPANVFDYFEIDENTITDAKDLLSGQKYSHSVARDSHYSLSVKMHSATLIKFSVS